MTARALDQIIVQNGRRRVDPKKVQELSQSIAQVGLLNPITITQQGVLVAGRHRLEACRLLGWQDMPVTVVALDEMRAELAMLDENLFRNDGTVLERAEWLKRRKEIYEALHPETRRGCAPGNQHTGKKRKSEIISFYQNSAIKMGVSPRTIQQEVQIATSLADDVREALRDTAVADRKTDLLKLARMDTERQREVATRIADGKADTVTAAQRHILREEREMRTANKMESPPNTDSRYRAIVIDPPWPVQKILRDERPNQDTFDYPTMTLEEIASLPIRDLADDDGCHVYLWVTHKFLPKGLLLFDQWGVRYECLMTWRKNVGFTPFSWMYSTEHVLFGRIGRLDVLRKGLRLDFEAKVARHSAKPDEFYERVVQASPGPRLELFARAERPGFEVWGNEV
jgi:N6-adenosine-specific RNA methylase IME4